MHRALAHSLSVLMLMMSTATAARGQQAWPRATPPEPLLTQFFRDLAPDEELVTNGREQLARSITVRRHDFDRDGVGEWVIEGTRYCGTNCRYWIYRGGMAGPFAQVFAGGGVLQLQPGGARGWPTLVSRAHMSCCEAFLDRYQFQGRRYVWRATEYRGDTNTPNPRIIYSLWISDPEARARHLDLNPADAGEGLRISARYQLCAGAGCDGPELRLTSGALPAGEVCVTIRAIRHLDDSPRPAEAMRLCGRTTAAAAAAGSTLRTLVLRPSRADWGRLWHAEEIELDGPGLPAKITPEAADAIGSFAQRLASYYRLECAPGDDCSAAP